MSGVQFRRLHCSRQTSGRLSVPSAAKAPTATPFPPPTACCSIDRWATLLPSCKQLVVFLREILAQGPFASWYPVSTPVALTVTSRSQPVASRRPMKRVKRSESRIFVRFFVAPTILLRSRVSFSCWPLCSTFIGCFFAPKTECFPINTASSDAFANLFDCCIQKGLSQIGVVDDAR